MAQVVLLRGANVGKRRFSPKALVAALADLELVSIGAAGTFIAPRAVGAEDLRRRIQGELPWPDAEMMILAGDEVQAALEAGAHVQVPAGAKQFGTALDQIPAHVPDLPLEVAAKETWGVRYEMLVGRVAVGVRRRVDEVGIYPNDALEKALQVRSTSRDWPTWQKIGAALP